MELVPENVSEKDLKEEVNRRTAKAGYTTRFGEPPYRTKIIVTSGFGETKLNIWPRDKKGNLID
jgi:hypothetical protein